jgi:hypothetical protein
VTSRTLVSLRVAATPERAFDVFTREIGTANDNGQFGRALLSKVQNNSGANIYRRTTGQSLIRR